MPGGAWAWGGDGVGWGPAAAIPAVNCGYFLVTCLYPMWDLVLALSLSWGSGAIRALGGGCFVAAGAEGGAVRQAWLISQK